MNKYWFKKNSKGKGSIPVTWEGCILFVLVIGLLVDAGHIVSGLIPVMIFCGVVAAIGYKLMELKTHPEERYDRKKDKITKQQILGVLLGFIIFFGGVIAVGVTNIKYERATVGSFVRLENDSSWSEFHSVKDDFTVLLPTYPSFSSQSRAIPNTDITVNASSYDSKSTLGEFIIAIIPKPVTDSTFDVHKALNSAVEATISNLKMQTGEDPILATSSISTMLGYPSVSFTIYLNKENSVLRGIDFVTDKQFYSLSFVDNKNQDNEANYAKFADSFKFGGSK